jgi:MraZ protein
VEERTVAGFVGRFEHSVDAKGRVILPARYREAFTRGGFLSSHREGCIALWTPGEFERQTAEMLESSKSDREGRNKARLWAGDAMEVEIDKQGRLAVPSRLRNFSNLEADVLIVGVIDHIELWNPTSWEERVQPTEQWFLEDDA